MNWLGHHEFGLNHKPFNFKIKGNEIDQNSKRSPQTTEYWIDCWIHYYQYALEKKEIIWVDYEDFLNHPADVMKALAKALGFFEGLAIPPVFDKKTTIAPAVDAKLLERASEIHRKLKAKKLRISE